MCYICLQVLASVYVRAVSLCDSCVDYMKTAVELAAISIRQATLFAHQIDHVMSERVTPKPSFIASDSDRYCWRNGVESE